MVNTLFSEGFDQNLSYLITAPDSGDIALVDPCGMVLAQLEALKKLPLSLRYILLTHGHEDHFDALSAVFERCGRASVVAHPLHPLNPDLPAADQAELPFGRSAIKVHHTPGHSRDSVVFEYPLDRALFTGDTLFVDCIGFCRSRRKMAASLRRLRELPDDLTVYPGHDYGMVPCRTLGEEKAANPEFSPAFIARLDAVE